MSKLDELIQQYCPDGVEILTISDIALKFTDGMHNLPKTSIEKSGYPILSAQNINNGLIDMNASKYVDEDTFNRENKRTNVKKGDLLLTIVGAIGRVAVVENNLKALFQRSVCVIKPNNDIVTSKYLRYALESTTVQAFIQLNAHGAAQKGIYLKDVGKIKIPVPPLEVQGEIVRILDNFTELTAELTVELTARKKQYEFYRDKLLNFGNVRGEATSDVAWRALSEIADISTGSSNTDDAVEGGCYPFFVRSQQPLAKDEYEYDEEAIITAGDGVGVGKVFHYINGKYALHQRAYRIHPATDGLLGKYLYYYFVATFPKYIGQQMYQGSVPSIRRPMLNKFQVAIPSLDVQKRIVNVLDNFDAICSDLKIGLPAEIEARQKQYEFYRDKLLTFKESTNGQKETL